MNHNTLDYRTAICILSIFICTFLLTGCMEKPDCSPVEDSESYVIVDYTVTESSTRAISHDALPAHERIKSLTYLLYDGSGKFVKRREIPGIGTMQEGDWPMKRSTMSWEQREALKDTLKAGQNYTAIFAANADQELFGGEEVLHMTEKMDGKYVPSNLKNVYLSLPEQRAFEDNNMFYLCVREIVPDGSIDREHHLDCPVMLQRIVSRTDFFSDDYPAWESPFAMGKIREFTDKVYGQLIPVTSTAELHIKEMLQRFTTEFYEFTYQYTLIPGEGVVYAAWVADLANRVNNCDCTQLVNDIQSADETAIKDILYNSCRSNLKLQSMWQPWDGLHAKVAYNSCADRFYIGDLTSGSNADGMMQLTPMLDIVKMPGADAGQDQHTFTLIGFGENPDAISGNEQNSMKEVLLYKDPESSTPLVSIPFPSDMQSFAGQGKNERVQLEYTPIKTLRYNEGFTSGKTYRLQPVNLKSILPGSLFVSSVYVGRLQEFFDAEEGRQYGTDLEHFIIEITLPDLAAEAALTIEPEWRLKQ